MILNLFLKNDGKSNNHGRVIKWTWHIGFLTLVGMDPVVEGESWEKF